MSKKMILAMMMGLASSSGFNTESYLPRKVPSGKHGQSDEDREDAILKAQQKRDRKALKNKVAREIV